MRRRTAPVRDRGGRAQTRPLGAATSRDVAAGQQIFDAQCAWCHGTAGDRRHRAEPARADAAPRDDRRDAGRRSSRNGIPGTDMPAFRIPLTEQHPWQTAAYVQSLARTRAAAVPGNAAARRARCTSPHGCASCHVVDGRGGVLGPELTSIGAPPRPGVPARRDRQAGGGASARLSGGAGGADQRRRDPRHSRQRRRVLDPHSRYAAARCTRCRSPTCRASIASSKGTLMPSYASRLSAGGARRSGGVSGDAAGWRNEESAYRSAQRRSRCMSPLSSRWHPSRSSRRTASG